MMINVRESPEPDIDERGHPALVTIGRIVNGWKSRGPFPRPLLVIHPLRGKMATMTMAMMIDAEE